MSKQARSVLQMGDIVQKMSKKQTIFADICKERCKVLQSTVEVLSRGGVVALPTDTVYGLITLYSHSQQLLDVKKRDPKKPIGLFFANPELIFDYTYPTVDKELLYKLLPGRVTLLLQRLPSFPSHFIYENDLLGVRVPDNAFIREVCTEFDEPIAQTSANTSGNASSTQPEEFEELWESIDLVLHDKESCSKGRVGSTIIDLSEKGYYSIVREGCIREHCERILIDHGLKQK
ncbi:unnamed protein product [Bursaphelenchus okinawaensis]|uniref:Threonylcarbamoyl-AMP synthase n=1 Tax=Bursaphelenchus okinawaensis TaxID=465554 RepID=A0A811JUE9_9BILA|nr:unnamed protein product [Bursaphelenchus okinawaensis]CAG9083549.1 unnamed protein product [Bursaphelenchus okinawaensis]